MDLIKTILFAPFKAVWMFMVAIEDARAMQEEFYKKHGNRYLWLEDFFHFGYLEWLPAVSVGPINIWSGATVLIGKI